MSMCNSIVEMKAECSSIRGGMRTERTKVSCIHLAAWSSPGMHLRFGSWPITVVVPGGVVVGG